MKTLYTFGIDGPDGQIFEDTFSNYDEVMREARNYMIDNDYEEVCIFKVKPVSIARLKVKVKTTKL